MMHIYIYICICIYVYFYIVIYICIYIYTLYITVFKCTQVHTCIHIYVHTRTYLQPWIALRVMSDAALLLGDAIMVVTMKDNTDKNDIPVAVLLGHHHECWP